MEPFQLACLEGLGNREIRWQDLLRRRRPDPQGDADCRGLLRFVVQQEWPLRPPLLHLDRREDFSRSSEIKHEPLIDRQLTRTQIAASIAARHARGR